MQKILYCLPCDENTKKIKNDLVAFEFKSDVTFHTLCILDISSLNVRSGGKLSRNIYVGSQAQLPVSSFFVLCLF
jgi:hypothetical protein